MIPCQKCGHVNPLSTVFCHGCGVRLEVNYAEVAQSVVGSKKVQLDDSIFRWGRSAFGLCSFLLVCALVLRYVMVPPMPIAEFPPPPPSELFPKEAPAWTGAAPGETVSAAIAVAGNTRLDWRRENATAILGALGVDRQRVQGWQKALLADQASDGSFSGSDAIAATALAATALQACPTDDLVFTAAQRAREWLLKHGAEISQKPALARSLFALALLDAEQLSDTLRGKLSVFLVDGAAPFWQAYALPLYSVDHRPNQLVAIKSGLKTPLWNDFFTLLDGQRPKPDPTLYSADAAKRLTSGEERLVWAFQSWHFPASPTDLASVLRTWSAEAPAAVSADLAKACGAHAGESVAIMTVCAPLRLPPLSLQR